MTTTQDRCSCCGEINPEIEDNYTTCCNEPTETVEVQL